MELYWEQVGNPESEDCIIFLHEGLGCVAMWRDYPEAVCKALGVRGIIYDRAGYGKSKGSLRSRKADYLQLAAIELRSVIVQLRINKPVLYGHSDGGSIALIYAAQYPKEIQAVITEAAHVLNEAETVAGVKAARPLLDAGHLDGLYKYHGDRYKEVFYAWNDIWLHHSFLDWNITDCLEHIEVPQLIIQGMDDEYGTLNQVEAIRELTKGESQTLTPNNCGHAPFKEQRELVLSSTVKFLNGIF